MPKNWCFWTVVLEKTLQSPLNCREIQPVHPKGNQYWILTGRTDAEAESPILWPPDKKKWLIWKDLDAGQDLRQEEKGTTQYEMVGWHHWLDWHEFEWALGVGNGQGSLACCSPWGCKESDTNERLNWTEAKKPTKLSVSNYYCNPALTLLESISSLPCFFKKKKKGPKLNNLKLFHVGSSPKALGRSNHK